MRTWCVLIALLVLPSPTWAQTVVMDPEWVEWEVKTADHTGTIVAGPNQGQPLTTEYMLYWSAFGTSWNFSKSLGKPTPYAAGASADRAKLRAQVPEFKNLPEGANFKAIVAAVGPDKPNGERSAESGPFAKTPTVYVPQGPDAPTNVTLRK